mgnify:CR=1 FL=1
MKITRSQLKKIIKEELNEIYGDRYVRGVDRESPDFLRWKAQQKPTALERELESRPSLEFRVDRIEEKLDELIQTLGSDKTMEI